MYKRRRYKEYTEEEKANRTIILGISMIIIGAILFYFGYNFYQSNLESTMSELYTESTARVIDFDKEVEYYYVNGDRRRRTVCEIEYTYDVNGTTYTDTTSSCLNEPVVGTNIVIYYENADPSSILFEFDNHFNWFLFLLLPVGGILVTGLGIYKRHQFYYG